MTASASDAAGATDREGWTFTTSGGIALAGDRHGPRDGRAVLLLHGGGQTRHAWKDAGRTLGAQGYRALSLDARGHGDSGWASDGDYSQDAMVRDLVDVVGSLGGRPPALVGASMGGITSLIAIGEGKVEAGALVLVDVAPRLEADGVERVQHFMRSNPDGFASLEEVADAISQYQPHRPRPRRLDGLQKNLRPMPSGRLRWHWDPDFMRRPYDTETMHRRLVDCARRIRIPVLLVRGGMSDVLSEDGAAELMELCPHAEYVNIADAAHMIAGDRNDLFGRSTVAFLNRVMPPAPG